MSNTEQNNEKSSLSHAILIVEDEVKLANVLHDYVKAANFTAHVIHHGDEVITWVKAHQPQAILLDIMLPGKNGIELCKEIRQFSNVPILMVTAKVDEIDRLLGLELGADDYICKPFSPREVIARVKAVLRRTQTTTQTNNLLILNEHKFTVTFHHEEAALTSVEFQLLKRLTDQPDRIFTRDQLMERMYVDNRIVNYRTIDSHIKKLRKKLADISDQKDWIQSVYGVGYRLVL